MSAKGVRDKVLGLRLTQEPFYSRTGINLNLVYTLKIGGVIIHRQKWCNFSTEPALASFGSISKGAKNSRFPHAYAFHFLCQMNR